MIKNKVMHELLKSKLLKPYDVVEHSYTDGGKRELQNLIVSKDGMFNCLTTRPDTLGIAVESKKDDCHGIERERE